MKLIKKNSLFCIVKIFIVNILDFNSEKNILNLFIKIAKKSFNNGL